MTETIGGVELACEDCMKLMARYPDKHFDLAITDPPYGGGNHETLNYKCPMKFGERFKKYKEFKKKRSSIRTGGGWSNKYGDGINGWDKAPPPEYFQELFRVSEYQIIWGGNYFGLPASRNFIVWRKKTISENFSMAMAELAWTNIKGNAKVFEYQPQDLDRFHPTQKPIALYKWLLLNYAKPGMKILDTHFGSGTSAVACLDMGYSLTACEIDKDYFEAAVKRLRLFAAQGTFGFGGQNENA